MLLSQYWENEQYDSAPKIVSHFGGTNNIFVTTTPTQGNLVTRISTPTQSNIRIGSGFWKTGRRIGSGFWKLGRKLQGRDTKHSQGKI